MVERKSKYRLFRLEFPYGVHFGKRALEDTDITFYADTLFSAFCQEAVRQGTLNRWLELFEKNRLWISDAFPYVKQEYYLPKPIMWIKTERPGGDSVEKKKYKKLKYIPAKYIKEYFMGEFPIDLGFPEIGQESMRVSAKVRGEEETTPYRIKIFQFSEGAGLYFIAKGEEDALQFLEELLFAVSYSGIGGKKYAGLGRFEFMTCKIPDELETLLENKGEIHMLISSALPKTEELQKATEHGYFQLIKRSGFIDSANYSDRQMRKRDLYVFQSGSCFTSSFSGQIVDVSDGGKHPVYRYAKAMFLGVSI